MEGRGQHQIEEAQGAGSTLVQRTQEPPPLLFHRLAKVMTWLPFLKNHHLHSALLAFPKKLSTKYTSSTNISSS
jgi:hypothetical protein